MGVREVGINMVLVWCWGKSDKRREIKLEILLREDNVKKSKRVVGELGVWCWKKE